MHRDRFSHVRHWVFDLDNTLYPSEARLFDQIEVRMTAWVMEALSVGREEADRLRRAYWHRYGTTLAGLIEEHGVDPAPYLTDVHEISLDALAPDPLLAERIASLPGRRIVYTNGSEPYARRVLEARGLSKVFDDVFGVEHAEYRPKPERRAFETVFGKAAVAPDEAAMFEDEPRNLREPFAMGLRTVLVGPDAPDAEHIDVHTTDLSAFLADLLDDRSPHTRT